jgi:hypothetical protein
MLPVECGVSLVGIAKELGCEGLTIAQAAKKHSVPLTSERRNREELKNLLARFYNNETESLGLEVKALNSELAHGRKIIDYLLLMSGGIYKNDQRMSYCPWLKDYIVNSVEQGASQREMSNLTGISINTLSHFREAIKPFQPEDLKPDHVFIANVWGQAKAHHKKTLDSFWSYLGRYHSNYAISFAKVRQILIDLGLKYPRGFQIDNKGTQEKGKFAPHSIWEGDAKQINIYIAGKLYKFSWYAFTDQNTTLIVGSNIASAESAQNLLDALKDGKDSTDQWR